MRRDSSPGNTGLGDRRRRFPVGGWPLAGAAVLLGVALGPTVALGQLLERVAYPEQTTHELLRQPPGLFGTGQQRDAASRKEGLSSSLHEDSRSARVVQRQLPGAYAQTGCVGRGGFGLFLAPEDRHRGVGQPLLCESWRYRPFSAGWFIGMVQGSTLIDDWVGGEQGFFGGYRLGWDYDHYWGCEMRFAFGNVALYDSQRAKDAQRAGDDALGLAADDPFRRRFERRRDGTFGLWDISLLYYPWGDAAWRPYLMAGLGTQRIELVDRLSARRQETAFGLPLAIGLKYRCNDWVAVRLECADNMAFGDTFDAVHHVSLTGGVEVRFGGRRVAYWPWKAGRHYW